MSTSTPTTAPTALVYDGRCPELFLVFDRQVKRWIRRKFKGLTKYFWDGKLPTITDDNYKELCMAIYQSLLKTNPSYASKVWKKRAAPQGYVHCNDIYIHLYPTRSPE